MDRDEAIDGVTRAIATENGWAHSEDVAMARETAEVVVDWMQDEGLIPWPQV